MGNSCQTYVDHLNRQDSKPLTNNHLVKQYLKTENQKPEETPDGLSVPQKYHRTFGVKKLYEFYELFEQYTDERVRMEIVSHIMDNDGVYYHNTLYPPTGYDNDYFQDNIYREGNIAIRIRLETGTIIYYKHNEELKRWYFVDQTDHPYSQYYEQLANKSTREQTIEHLENHNEATDCGEGWVKYYDGLNMIIINYDDHSISYYERNERKNKWKF